MDKIKKLFRIISYLWNNFEADIASIKEDVSFHNKLVKDNTFIDVDVSTNAYDYSHIIVSGIFRNRQYVRTFSIRHDNLLELVEILKSMERRATVRRLDRPYNMEYVDDILKPKNRING